MERNWKLDKNESLNWKGRTLYRVVLTKDCEHGKAGQRMGWIEKDSENQ